MTNIRRYFQPGTTCFLTHVTYQRMPILADHFDLLWKAIEIEHDKTDFDLTAWVALPDHIHMLLDAKDSDVSSMMRRIKLRFSTNYRKRMGLHNGRVWQNRFWDHLIRDQLDCNRHIDYIHYNPVKHGCVTNPFEYKYSSIGEYYESDYYQDDWGNKEPDGIGGEYGE